MITIYTHKKPLIAQVETAKQELEKNKGLATLKLVDCGDHYVLVDDCHVLEAARQLNLPIQFAILEQDEILDPSSLSYGYKVAKGVKTYGELAYWLCGDGQCGVYEYTEAPALEEGDKYLNLVFFPDGTKFL